MFSKDKRNKKTMLMSRREMFYRGEHNLTGTASGLNRKFEGDLAILNVALGLEHQAIAAYNAGAGSKLLSPDQLKVAVSFQSEHKHHRDEIIKLIRRFKGTPVEPKSSYDFGTITSATDLIKLARDLEEGAAKAYLANAYKLESYEILSAAVPILVDEVRHTTVFNQLLGLSVTDRLKV
ncbi:MAG: ferritin-like domain-containing protein [Acidobacteriota bacterium]|nr:ferritin-like domain-containing protein [Acidobacteriota bacterium]